MGRLLSEDALFVALPLGARLLPDDGPPSTFRLTVPALEGLTVMDNGMEAVEWLSESFVCDRRALSCFICTCRKCVSKSCHRISSVRRIVDLVGMPAVLGWLELN